MSDGFIDITLAEPAVRSAIFEYVKKYFNFDPATIDVRNIALPDAQGREAIVRILPKPPEKKPEADQDGPDKVALTLPLSLARQREVMRNLLGSFSGGAESPEEQQDIFLGQEALWRANERSIRGIVLGQDRGIKASHPLIDLWSRRDPSDPDSHWFVFLYKNHRGIIERRAVITPRPVWGTCKHHPGNEPGWYFTGFDLRAWDIRSFRAADVISWGFRPACIEPPKLILDLARSWYDRATEEDRKAIRMATPTDAFSNLVVNK